MISMLTQEAEYGIAYLFYNLSIFKLVIYLE